MELWITGATLVTQNSSREVRKAHLRIVDGSIAEIRRSAPARFSKGARRIDASGLFVLPGFVQAHVHLCQTAFRNQADDLELLDWLSQRIWKMEAAHTYSSLKKSAQTGIKELLSSGTTCILDMATVRHTEAVLEAVKESGIRANVGKCLMDHPEHTPESLRESTEKALNEALKLYKKWNETSDGRIRVSFAPRFVISCTEKLLREIARISAETGALIHTHASENKKEIEWVKKVTGHENIHYLEHLGLASSRLVLAHCVHPASGETEVLRRNGVHVAHCPSSNLKLASGIAPIPEYLKQGINVALGADGAPCNNNLNIFNEMRLAALIQKPLHGPTCMRAPEVLDMATLGGAKALGWLDQIGSIEVGKRADLVAMNLNGIENQVSGSDLESIASSVVYSSQPAHVQWTMVNGRTVFRRKSF